jgi:enoyl-[acyl-carrier protein] reductase I
MSSYSLAGRKYLIFGVANDRSIAWGITQALAAAGAQVALTYVNEAIERRVRPLAAEVSAELVLPCDVQHDESLDAVFAEVKRHWGVLDGVVHSVAFAEKEALGSRFSSTTRAGFRLALDVSAYSLIAVAGRALPLMAEKGGSILTLSYLGAQRVIPNYNIMGIAKAALEASVRYLAADLGAQNIRVNAISAGPIKTLAASGIPQFRELQAAFAERAPLKRNVTQEDVANVARFYLSPEAGGITGELTYVDCGYNVMGV